MLPERLETVAHEIALDMQADLPGIAQDWMDRMAMEPELARWTAPEFRELGFQNALLDIGREIAGLVHGRVLPDTCPPEILESAELSVASDYPQWASLQAYRAGHAVQWRAWASRVEARSLSADDRLQLLEAGSEYMFAYADRCSRWMEIELSRIRTERMRGEEQRRTQLVRDLLEGRTREAKGLDYELAGWHTGIIVTGDGAAQIGSQLAAQAREPVLAVVADIVTWWGWFSSTVPSRNVPERNLRALGVPAGHVAAFGHPGSGVDGFVATHREARRTIDLSARLGMTVATHDDIALEDLAIADPDRARHFVERELGELAAPTHRAEILRDTLRAYFAAAQTASAAARILSVHERTVGNRLQSVERITGHAVGARRAELEAALRLRRLLDEP